MYFSFLYVVTSKTSICVTFTTYMYVGMELLTEIIYENNSVLVYKIH